MGLRAATGQQHDYQTCRDDDCPRYTCNVYKEGYADGYGAGAAAGYAIGYGDGMAAGYSQG